VHHLSRDDAGRRTLAPDNSANPRSHVIELESTIKSTMKLRQRRARHDGLDPEEIEGVRIQDD
jgi:hypothetical protein